MTIKKKKRDGGVMIPASHNSAAYNGFKIKLPPGVSAPSFFTQQVEKNVPSKLSTPTKILKIQKADWLPFYLKRLKTKVNLALLQKSGLKVVVDSMHQPGEKHF